MERYSGIRLHAERTGADNCARGEKDVPHSLQLWRTIRAAAEISRQAAFGNLRAELNPCVARVRGNLFHIVALLTI
jgi:hypothetical protein